MQNLPTSLVIYLVAMAAVLGAIMGSALNCLALRMVAGKKWAGNERSECPHCRHTLTAVELIPVVSWLVQGGKCRHCGAKISPRYLLAELALAVIFGSTMLVYGLTVHTGVLLVLLACLFALSLVDLDTQIIPDRFLVIPAVVRLAELAVTDWRSIPGALVPGLCLGGGVLVISLIMDKVLKKDTMGGGDIKLLALLGFFLPLPQCMLLLMLACVIGILMASILMKVNSETPFPFGPALSIAAWITLLIGDGVIGWYLGLFL